MKISKLEIIARDRVNQPLYPYVKPTDYYLDILGEKSPTEAAMIDNVAILKMTADDGSSSYFNTSSLVADYALTLFRKIENWDVSEIEMAWDFLYRYSLPLGRAGVTMHAISVIDLMMYDLYARHLKIPVYNLLGGRTRSKIKAYASHLHPLPLKELQKEAQEYLDDGYRVMKMRFSSGPADPNAMEKNEELAADAWMSWTYNFAVRMLRKLEKYDLAWVEEPLYPDDFEGFKTLTKNVETPISAGEHHYHVHDMKKLLDAGIRILQPDTMWTGGLTSMKKIAGLAEAYGAQVIPHAGNVYNLHFIISEPQAVTPMSEYLTKYREWMEQHMTGIPHPKNGYITLPEKPGFGVEYDGGK
jgi:L-alanine-DL-glutamate epimerase-like enolase superfamily enzyme